MEYDKNILDHYLNNQVSLTEFFAAFGYDRKDKIFLRTIPDSPKDKKTGRTAKYEVDYPRIDSIIPTMQHDNSQRKGVFFVVNGGGQNDNEVKTARACYIDGDELTLEEQLKMLCDFPLEPSIIIRTKKSLHAYWITPHGDIKQFRTLQQRFIQHFKSDSTIQNESRVMRLFGFMHCKETPVEVRLIKFDPDITYSQKQLAEALPELKKLPVKAAESVAAKGADVLLIEHGHRHDYVVRRIGHYVATLPGTTEGVIFATVYQDFLENCEQIPEDSREEFWRRYMPTIRKFQAANAATSQDALFRKYAMKAWKDENPGKEYDKTSCPWSDVVEAGLRAKMKEQEMEDGLRLHTEAREKEQNPTGPEQEQAASVAPAEVKQADGLTEDNNQLTPCEEIDAFLDEITTYRYAPIPTGIAGLDEILHGGLIRQEIVTLAAAPGMGKTTLCQQIAEAIAESGAKVLYFNLEMSREQMFARSLSRAGAADLTTLDILQAYKLTREQVAAVRAAAWEYKSRVKDNLIYNPCYYDTKAKKNIPTDTDFDSIMKSIMQAAKRAQAASEAAPIVFIDYLHLLRGPEEDAGALIKRAMSQLKDYAKEYNTLVFTITANNRTSNRDGRATMDSGRDSSAIEYSGDVMLALNYKLSDTASSTGEKKTASQVTEEIQKYRERGEKLPIDYRLYSLRVTKSRFTEANSRTLLEFDGAHSKFLPYATASQKRAQPKSAKQPQQPRDAVLNQRAKRERRRQDFIDAYQALEREPGGVTLEVMSNYLGVSQATVKRSLNDLLPGVYAIDSISGQITRTKYKQNPDDIPPSNPDGKTTTEEHDPEQLDFNSVIEFEYDDLTEAEDDE